MGIRYHRARFSANVLGLRGCWIFRVPAESGKVLKSSSAVFRDEPLAPTRRAYPRIADKPSKCDAPACRRRSGRNRQPSSGQDLLTATRRAWFEQNGPFCLRSALQNHSLTKGDPQDWRAADPVKRTMTANECAEPCGMQVTRSAMLQGHGTNPRPQGPAHHGRHRLL